jgi:hypothetical protein
MRGTPAGEEGRFVARILACGALLSDRYSKERCHACWGRGACRCEATSKPNVACVGGLHTIPGVARNKRKKVGGFDIVNRDSVARHRARRSVTA